MKRIPIAALALAATALIATGCGSSSSSSSATGSTATQKVSKQTTTASPTGGTVIEVAKTPKLGPVLVDGKTSMTVYLFEKDKGGQSSCYGACATTWPPVISTGQPQALKGAAASKLSTVKRKDGQEQVVYGKWPLYFYALDQKPGDTTGNDVTQYGAQWYALKASGVKASD